MAAREVISKELKDLLPAIEKLLIIDPSLKKPGRRAFVDGFQINRVELYRNVAKKRVSCIKETIRNESGKGKNASIDKVALTIMYKIVQRMEEAYAKNMMEEMKGLIKEMEGYLYPKDDDDAELQILQESGQRKAIGRPAQQEKVQENAPEPKKEAKDIGRPLEDFRLNRIPEEIRHDILEDLGEMRRCYDSGCHRSAIILCGRILETALYRKYFEKTEKDLLETCPGLGLGKIIAKLTEESIELPPGLTQQIHLINNTRIVSVHVKKQPFRPTQEQTHAIILFTVDALKHLFV